MITSLPTQIRTPHATFGQANGSRQRLTPRFSCSLTGPAQDEVRFSSRVRFITTENGEDDRVALAALKSLAKYLSDPDKAAADKVGAGELDDLKSLLGFIPANQPAGEKLLAEILADQPGLQTEIKDHWQPLNPFADRANLLKTALDFALEDRNGFQMLAATCLIKLTEIRGLRFASPLPGVDALFDNQKPIIKAHFMADGPLKEPDAMAVRSLVNLINKLYLEDFQQKQGADDETIEVFRRMIALIPDEDTQNELCKNNPVLRRELPLLQKADLPPHDDRAIESLTPKERTECLEYLLREGRKLDKPFIVLAAMLLLHVTQKLNLLPRGEINAENPFSF